MLCFIWIMDVCDICRDVWIMDMNMKYIVFCVMEFGCDVIYYVVRDEIWIWNAKIKKIKFFLALPSATLGKGAMALGKVGKPGTPFGNFAECQAP